MHELVEDQLTVVLPEELSSMLNLGDGTIDSWIMSIDDQEISSHRNYDGIFFAKSATEWDYESDPSTYSCDVPIFSINEQTSHVDKIGHVRAIRGYENTPEPKRVLIVLCVSAYTKKILSALKRDMINVRISANHA